MRRPQDQQGTQPEATAAKKPKRSARAIAVVEFLPGGGSRLVPIALWYEGKYFDASTYDANPSPLAVAPGTVYQALNNGEPAGTFVVNLPKLSNTGWIGDGRWTPQRTLDDQRAAEAAKQPKAKSKASKAIFTGDSDNGPPVLRRPGSDQSSEQSSTPTDAPEQAQKPATNQAQSPTSTAAQQAAGATPTTPEPSPGRPTLRRPDDEPASAPAAPVQVAATQPQNVDDSDPDRPVFRRTSPPPDSASASPSKQPPAAAPANSNDPDRPLLTRGDQPPAPQSKPRIAASGTNAPAAKTAAKDSSTRSLAAISDAGKYETRPLVYATTPERQQELQHELSALALADIRAFAAKRASGPRVPKDAALTDYDLRFFDLDFSNSPTLVLTAKLPTPAAGSRPFAYYATYVAHLDINGELVKVFSSVTDTTHLDVFPRLELIDALDADANGRGDLLFRQYSDTGVNYGLYRVFPYNMEKIFEGGGSL